MILKTRHFSCAELVRLTSSMMFLKARIGGVSSAAGGPKSATPLPRQQRFFTGAATTSGPGAGRVVEPVEGRQVLDFPRSIAIHRTLPGGSGNITGRASRIETPRVARWLPDPASEPISGSTPPLRRSVPRCVSRTGHFFAHCPHPLQLEASNTPRRAR